MGGSRHKCGKVAAEAKDTAIRVMKVTVWSGTLRPYDWLPARPTRLTHG